MGCSSDPNIQNWLRKRIGSNAWTNQYPDVKIDAERQIRVLNLLPATLKEAPLCGELNVVALHTGNLAESHCALFASLTCYEALSYAWGAWENQGEIQMNGETKFPITQNLDKALRRLRHPHSIRRLWVDQICIDQKNLDERSKQVSFMDQVYRHASRVLVWLGDTDWLDDADDVAPAEDKTFATQEAQDVLQKLAALQDCLESTRPAWSRRSWVVQEFALAREDPVICFGRYTWTREAMEDVSWVLYQAYRVGRGDPFRSRSRRRRGRESDDDSSHVWDMIYKDECLREVSQRGYRPALDLVNHGFDPFWRIRELSDQLENGGGHGAGRTLADFGAIIAISESTEPLDKIYSFLNMLRKSEKELITPNYRQDLLSVFAEVTYTSMSACGNLRLLSIIAIKEYSAMRAQLPSWVPDYTFACYTGMNSYKDLVSAFMGIFSDDGEDDLWGLPPQRPNWFTRHPFEGNYSDDGDDDVGTRPPDRPFWYAWYRRELNPLQYDATSWKLAAKGLRFDKICFVFMIPDTSVVKPWDDPAWDDPASHCAPNELETHVISSLDVGGSTYNRLTPTKDNLCGSGRLFDLQNVGTRLTRLYNSYKNIPRNDVTGLLFLTWHRRLDRDVNNMSTYMTKSRDGWPEYFKFVHGSEALFVTEAGFMGIGPGNVLEGDTVCLLYHGRRPAILRAEGSEYRFCGFAFVNGIMANELDERLDEIRLEEKEFVLV